MAITSMLDLVVPPRTAAHAPAPLRVRMVASMDAYYASNGILDRALELVLVRRDLPGVGFLAKTDPSLHFDPEPPLPRPPAGEERRGRITEEREIGLLDYGATHEGSARYWVVGAFAGAWSGPHPMEVEHPDRPVGVGDSRPPRRPDRNERRLLASRPATQGVWAGVHREGEWRIEGVMRVPLRIAAFHGMQDAAPWVTVVAIRHADEGGVAAACWQLEAEAEGRDRVASFSMPLAARTPALGPGPATVLVFAGDHRAPPLMLQIPGAEAGGA